MKRIFKQTAFSTVVAMAALAAAPNSASAGSDPFVGEINYVGFNYAPVGWLPCDGQLLPISQYQTLFALLGTSFGGDGRVNFALPDMRGKVPLHQGQSPGFSNYLFGTSGGNQQVTLSALTLPIHTHGATSTSTSTVAPGASATSTLKAVDAIANAQSPSGNSLAKTSDNARNPQAVNAAYSTTAPTVAMNAGSVVTTLNGLAVTTVTNTAIAPAGSTQPFSIMQPYTVLNCIIANQGIWPSRP